MDFWCFSQSPYLCHWEWEGEELPRLSWAGNQAGKCCDSFCSFYLSVMSELEFRIVFLAGIFNLMAVPWIFPAVDDS